jgi:hypothetical protein
MKFRKKPVIIEAMQFDGSDKSALEICFWSGMSSLFDEGTLKIETLEGTLTASPGDWIIKGIKGEFYPCKPDIFESTYEAV